jgi:UDP-N-acetylmuramate: L-alanyl-gamma-D-glutamyl-meso-diaminopimelate ligase
MGVEPAAAAAALASFLGVRRRLELRGEASGIRIYDDFAHHPTAIAATLDGLRRRAGGQRIVAVLEPRSATMKLGVHRSELAASLGGADRVWLYEPAGMGWTLDEVAAALSGKAAVAREIPALVAALARELKAGDEVVIMSNGGFGGLHDRLLQAIAAQAS